MSRENILIQISIADAESLIFILQRYSERMYFSCADDHAQDLCDKIKALLESDLNARCNNFCDMMEGGATISHEAFNRLSKAINKRKAK